MAGRGRTSFQKKQKEQLRLEKRQQKAARKEARKEAAKLNPGSEDSDLANAEDIAPFDLDLDQDSDRG